jgi:hypothetical protein
MGMDINPCSRRNIEQVDRLIGKSCEYIFLNKNEWYIMNEGIALDGCAHTHSRKTNLHK